MASPTLGAATAGISGGRRPVGPPDATEKRQDEFYRPFRQYPDHGRGDRSWPTLPAPNVSPDADQVRTSLIKPGHTFHATFHRPRGDFQPRGVNR